MPVCRPMRRLSQRPPAGPRRSFRSSHAMSNRLSLLRRRRRPRRAALVVRPDQLDLHTGIPRIQAQTTLGSVRLSAGVDLLNAGAHLGSLNDDGSRGENIGAGATVLGGELNIDYKGWTLTVGVAASLGGSISSGESRDLDGDGVEERCFAMSLGPFTLGECDEL